MQKEFWIKWLPIENLEETLYSTVSFFDDGTDVTLILKKYRTPEAKTPLLRIQFKGPIVFYSKTAESLCVIPKEYEVDYGTDIGKWPFFKIINSHLIIQLQKNLLQVEIPSFPLIHFVITEAESDVHIVSTSNPLVDMDFYD